MNSIRTLALAAVMAMAAMPGMAGEAARKVCVVNGDLNGWSRKATCPYAAAWLKRQNETTG